MPTPLLTPADHDRFLQEGCLLLRQVVPLALCQAAVAELEAGQYTGTVGAADYRPVRGKAVEACLTDGVMQALQELSGEAYPLPHWRGGSDMPRPHQPAANWPEPQAHVDDDYPTLMPNGWSLGTFLFLTRVQSRGGAFIAFPGSPGRYRRLLLRDAACLKELAAVPAHSGAWRETIAEPGDLLIFHHLGGHCGSNNVADPVTRHALLSRWHPKRRVIPGDQPFAAMSTVEKANSARYDGLALKLPAASLVTPALAHGLPADTLTVTDTCWADGQAHLLALDASQPTLVRQWSSPDFSTWHEAAPLAPDLGPLRHLHLHRRGPKLQFYLLSADGRQVRYERGPGEAWQGALSQPFDSPALSVIYNSPYDSKIAHGWVRFSLASEDDSRIVSHSGKTLADWPAAPPQLVHQASEAIHDFIIAPVLGEGRYALLADLAGGPAWSLSSDNARYEQPLQSLASDAPGELHGLRPILRAREYWLVSLRQALPGATPRLRWGTIDWAEPTPTLRVIHTAEDLHSALSTVGLI